MALRTKVLLLISLTLAGLIAALYLLSSTIVLDGFAKVEQEDVLQNLGRAMDALSDDLATLDSKAGDWANWDDAYAFVQDGNPEFIAVNPTDTSFAQLNLNLILFVHRSGQVVFVKAFDLQNNVEVPPSQSLSDHFSRNSSLLQHRDSSPGASGILLLPEGPMLVAARSILTSQGQGPSQGTLVFGRYLDAVEVERLARQVHLSLDVYQWDEAQLPPDFQAARTRLSGDGPPLVQPLNAGSISGYAVLPDIHGQPALLLRANLPRAIYQQGQTSVRYFMAALLAVGLAFAAGIYLVISRLILSQLARRESEERYRAVVEQAAEGILLVDTETKQFLQTNTAFQRLFGYAADEAHQLTMSDVLWSGSEDLSSTRPHMRATPLPLAGEQQWHRKDGSLLDVEVNTSRIAYSGKEALCVIVHNITEHKQARAALAATNVELEHALLRANELASAAQEANQLKSEFLATISHELRTPLTGILGSLDLILDDQCDTPDEERVFLQMAQRAARNLLSIINDVLDLARIEAGKMEVETQAVNVSSLLDEICFFIEAQAEAKHLCLEVLWPSEEIPPAWADPDKLRQILLNLVGNALKFTEQGSITMSAQVDEAAGTIQIAVQDTGIGIPPEKQAKLFQPFVQADGSTTRQYGGTGLGLSISRRLAEMMGGTLTLCSAGAGQGSTFTLTLPLAESSGLPLAVLPRKPVLLPSSLPL